jgi:hypothetical protein
MMDGLVASLNRPGGNATGVSLLTNSLAPKRLEIIRELVPKAETIGLLVNAGNSLSGSQQIRETEAAVQTFGLRMRVFTASSPADFEPAFAAMANARIGALVVGSDAYFNSQRERMVALAARHSMPAIYEWRAYVEDGGLMSYGSDLAEGYRQVGLYAGTDPQGREPGRSAGRAVHEGRVRGQSEHCQDARSDIFAAADRPCRRGDRIGRWPGPIAYSRWWPSHRFAATQQLGPCRAEADIPRAGCRTDGE